MRQTTKIVKCGKKVVDALQEKLELRRSGWRVLRLLEINDNGYLVIEGGGNNLKWLRMKNALKTVIEGVD